MKGGDYEVEPPFLFRESYRLISTGNAAQFGGVTEVQSLVFIADELVESSILFKEIEVVEAGDKQDIPYPEPHEILESLEAVSVAVFDPEGIGGRSQLIKFCFQEALSAGE
jgi:hypothetical protein